jgi:hypothetical protein
MDYSAVRARFAIDASVCGEARRCGPRGAEDAILRDRFGRCHIT